MSPQGPIGRRWGAVRRTDRTLLAGLVIVGLVVAFGLIGPLLVNTKLANAASSPPRLPPSVAHLLGTDSQGRDMLAALVVGTPQTLKIGLIAGSVAIVAGVFLGLLAGFVGGKLDAAIRLLVDTLLTVPGIAVLVLIAANVESMTVEVMGITVAALAWMVPARTIRAQTLSLRERPFIEVARANGEGTLELVFREIMPNLFPYIAAGFVIAAGGAMVAAVGLEALGLGATNTVTLGTTIYWAQNFSAVIRGIWWWWAPPIVMISLIIIGFFLLSAGLDRMADPRLRASSASRSPE